MQKAVIDSDIMSCLMEVNEDPRGDSVGSGIGNVFAALEGLASRIESVSNKQWELIEEEGNPALVNLEFRSEDTNFSCDYFDNSETGFELAEARRNGEVVYNQEINQRIIEEKEERLAMAEERQRVSQIKLWHEGGFSNTDNKYYDKNHLLSQSRFGEPALRVICRPEGPTIGLEGQPISMTGHRGVQFEFLISGQTTTESFDLTTAGTVGIWTESDFFSDVENDPDETHSFLDLLESATSITAAGVTFNVDDYTQVPCLSTRQEDLANQAQLYEQQQQRYEQYLSALKESGAETEHDDFTNETTYQVVDPTSGGDKIWDTDSGGSSLVLGTVTHDESKPLDADAFEITFLTYRYVQADETFASIEAIFVNETIREEIELSCEYDFPGSLQQQYGLANEICNLSPLITNQSIVELLKNEDTAVRFSANGMSIDSRNGTDVQKRFIEEFTRIALAIVLP
tara:strand:+ start:517 stop:1890 length:1374 start_codon:yes stop_codon:yes gene_type:complete